MVITIYITAETTGAPLYGVPVQWLSGMQQVHGAETRVDHVSHAGTMSLVRLSVSGLAGRARIPGVGTVCEIEEQGARR